MNQIERLVHNYVRRFATPWDHTLSTAQRVWFAVYDKTHERRVRACLGEFELATTKAAHRWVLHDVTDAFPQWMAAQDYRESYFESPEDLGDALKDFERQLADGLRKTLESADSRTVVALLGVGSLFGFTHVSQLIKDVHPAIRGRLLVFFPGEHERNVYRLLDARDGWNYMALAITCHEGEIVS